MQRPSGRLLPGCERAAGGNQAGINRSAGLGLRRAEQRLRVGVVVAHALPGDLDRPLQPPRVRLDHRRHHGSFLGS